MPRISIFTLFLSTSALFAADVKPEQLEADKKALTPIVKYVGDWKGAVMPKPAAGGPTVGWTEVMEWQYDLKGGRAALVFESKSNKYYKSGRIEPTDKEGVFKFTGILPDERKEEFTGEYKDKELVVINADPGDGRAAKIEFSLIANGNRLLMNFYKKKSAHAFMEVGLTREGGGFFKKGDTLECIITGGSPKIKVSYKGKDYYVCCGGCREAFEANPEKEIAAYMKRKEEEKTKK